jgi:hypothetical protein
VLFKASVFVSQQGIKPDFSGRTGLTIPSSVEQTIKKKIEKAGAPLKNLDINIYRSHTYQKLKTSNERSATGIEDMPLRHKPACR